MGLEDIKDQLREQFIELRSRIEESAAYNSLRERYENLSPGGQKGLILGGVLFAAFMMMYIPYSYFSASSDYVVEYDDKRQLIRKLLQASRIATSTGPVSNPPVAMALVETINSRLTRFNLLPEQTAAVAAISGAELGGGFAPPGIEQEGVKIDLSSLNLKQIVEIGYDLQNIMQGVRLVGLSMSPNAKDQRYFDVSYKIARFSLPGVAESSGPAIPNENSRVQPPRPGGQRNRFQPNNEVESAPPPPDAGGEEFVEEEGDVQ